MSRIIRTPGEAKSRADDIEADELPSTPVVVSVAGLPNAIDIDPKAISGPVLTRQGWVCPDESGKRPPDALKA